MSIPEALCRAHTHTPGPGLLFSAGLLILLCISAGNFSILENVLTADTIHSHCTAYL